LLTVQQSDIFTQAIKIHDLIQNRARIHYKNHYISLYITNIIIDPTDNNNHNFKAHNKNKIKQLLLFV
jgi:hypothetical protein